MISRSEVLTFVDSEDSYFPRVRSYYKPRVDAIMRHGLNRIVELESCCCPSVQGDKLSTHVKGGK